jgi:hypothetical protein
VTATAWDRVHPKLTHRTCWLDHTGTLPIIEGTLIRVQAEHLRGDRHPKPMWLWISTTEATSTDVDLAWQAYLRRFDLEHVRHEAHITVCSEGLHPRTVAAVRVKPRAARSGERRGRRKAALTTPRRAGTTRRPGFGKRDQKVERQ